MIELGMPVSDPDPSSWPVLVTGAGGFVGGHVARQLAAAGHRVQGLVRRPPQIEPGDPPIDWITGDLCDAGTIIRVVAKVRAVVHTASWVSLGADRRGDAVRINVEATRELLSAAHAAGVERFVYTSTLHTLAAGTADAPADEDSPWNLHTVDAPYSRTKRAAEDLVRAASSCSLETIVLCPGMVLGPRDPGPTSTRVVTSFANSPVVMVPAGGIPILDARVAARAHRRALIHGAPGARYAVVGPYLSYTELARLIGRLTGQRKLVRTLPDAWERPLRGLAGLASRLMPAMELSPATVGGGFLRLHISGQRADAVFGLVHPDAAETVRSVLETPSTEGRPLV